MKWLRTILVTGALFLAAAYSVSSLISARLLRKVKSTDLAVSLCRVASPYRTPTPPPARTGGVVFFGDSLTAFAPWDTLLPDVKLLNYGVSGESSLGALCRLGSVLAAKPAKIFLMIGINDLLGCLDASMASIGIEKLIRGIRAEIPDAQLYTLSILPLNHTLYTGCAKAEAIVEVNSSIRQSADRLGFRFIDLYAHVVDSTGLQLPRVLTEDGIHITNEGYRKWVTAIRPYLKTP